MFCRRSQPVSPARRLRDGGFSFVEILFAIAVLGIGFIMLAAIFPVGLQQTKLTLDETTAAGNARAGVASLQQIAQGQVLYGFPAPPTLPTYIIPDTVSLATHPLPVGGTGVGQLADGQSRTLPGQVRSFRDARLFVDAGLMTVPPAVNNNYDLRRNAIWNRVNTEMLNRANDRNGYALLYKRDLIATSKKDSTGTYTVTARPADSAQLIVINAQVAAQSAYTTTDVYNATAPLIYNLEPRPVGVRIAWDAGEQAFTIGFRSIRNTTASAAAPATADTFANRAEYDAALGAVTEGTFVVISDDRITAPVTDIGRMNGRIYRTGIARPDLGTNVYEMAPGYGFVRDPGASGLFNDTLPGDDIVSIGFNGTATDPQNPTFTSNGSNVVVAPTGTGPGAECAYAYVLGRGFTNSAVTPDGTGNSSYSGPAMDVAVYTTFVATP